MRNKFSMEKTPKQILSVRLSDTRGGQREFLVEWDRKGENREVREENSILETTWEVESNLQPEMINAFLAKPISEHSNKSRRKKAQPQRTVTEEPAKRKRTKKITKAEKTEEIAPANVQDIPAMSEPNAVLQNSPAKEKRPRESESIIVHTPTPKKYRQQLLSPMIVGSNVASTPLAPKSSSVAPPDSPLTTTPLLKAPIGEKLENQATSLKMPESEEKSQKSRRKLANDFNAVADDIVTPIPNILIDANLHGSPLVTHSPKRRLSGSPVKPQHEPPSYPTTFSGILNFLEDSKSSNGGSGGINKVAEWKDSPTKKGYVSPSKLKADSMLPPSADATSKILEGKKHTSKATTPYQYSPSKSMLKSQHQFLTEHQRERFGEKSTSIPALYSAIEPPSNPAVISEDSSSEAENPAIVRTNLDSKRVQVFESSNSMWINSEEKNSGAVDAFVKALDTFIASEAVSMLNTKQCTMCLKQLSSLSGLISRRLEEIG